MQRRAAAIYFVFFLVVGAGAYAYIGVAEQTHQPQYQLDGTTVESEGNATLDGKQYTLSEISHSEGGHGGGGALVSELSWTNESFLYTDTIENNSTVEIENESYQVAIANETDVSTFTLRQNDTTREFAEGDTIPYEGNDATITNVTAAEVQLEWTGAKEQSVELGEGQNVTLTNGQQYFAHYTGEEEVKLVPSNQYGDYAQTTDARHTFDERVNGLWGIVIVSFLSALTVLSTAYLPVRG
ncbi:hypothetical protein BRC91_06495 [Halobacteriales archaeon QS_4_62_28]|nr:MAG: hypothetical protein BRC91_06495 [Halobacteriales archaeon QS_4_62_28]